jgi:DNA polymerase III epsilon subunit-like protein
MRILVFDTETTGLPRTKIISPDTLDEWPHIVQFSYLVYDSSLNSIVKHGDNIIQLPSHVSIPEEATNIHKISNEMSATLGRPLKEVLNDFFFCARCVDKIVGHNVAFDINILKVELLRMINDKAGLMETEDMWWKGELHFISMFPYVSCTLTDSVDLCNIQAVNRFGKYYKKFPKLSELHEKLFGSTPKNLHNSFCDILVTLRCFMMMHHDVDLVSACRSFNQFALKANLYS